MKCEEILELLPLYLEDMLEEREKKTVEEHLMTCDTCKKELKFLESIAVEMKEMPELELSAGFTEKLHEKLVLEKQRKKVTIIAPRKWKSYCAALASAAVIAISVVALNTEFYKVDESVLRGKDEHNIENQVKMTETEDETNKKPLQEAKKDDSSVSGNNPKTVETTKKFAASDAKNETADYVAKAEKSELNENGKEESNLAEKALPASEIAADESVPAYTPESAAEENEIIAHTAEDYSDNEDKKVSSGGGGGGGSAATSRNFKIPDRFDKTVFVVTILEQNETITEKLSGFEKQGEEYKLPLDDFNKVTAEILASNDSDGYYVTESFTEEYNELTEKLNDDTTEDIASIEERLLGIKEICSYGYIIVK